MKPLRALSALLLISAPLLAHEFWLAPDKFFVAPNAPLSLTLNVGEDFTGVVRPFTAEKVAALRHYSAAGTVDLISRVPTVAGLDALPITFAQPGTHLIAEDARASTITLSPDKFLSYLNSDGLEFIDAARKAAKQENEPGRERYLRCVKTLVRVGDKSDATYAVRTGQRLEITPQSDPFAARPGTRRAGGETAPRLHGSIAFELPYAGPWMISLVHMIPLKDVPGTDWESYWGNLTFAVPTS